MTYERYGVVAPGSYDAEPLHHRVLDQRLGVRLQSLDGDVLRRGNIAAQPRLMCWLSRRWSSMLGLKYLYLCYPDVVEVDLHQVGVVPLHPQQRFFHVGGVGLFIWNWFVLGALDHA